MALPIYVNRIGGPWSVFFSFVWLSRGCGIFFRVGTKKAYDACVSTMLFLSTMMIK